MEKVFLALILFFGLSRASAQVPTFIGEQEGLTANTGIGRFGSTAAGYYNPSGLAGVEKDKISVSATAFQSYTQRVTGELDMYVQATQTMPTQVTSVWRVPYGTIALSVFSVRDFDFALPFKIEIEDVGTVPVRFKVSESMLAVGPSIARRLNESLSIGLSLLLLKVDRYSSAVIRDKKTLPAGTIDFMSFTEQKSNSLLALPVLGVHKQWNEKFATGLRLASPTFVVSGKRNSLEQNVTYFNDGVSITEISDPESDISEKESIKRPMEVGIGAVYQPREDLKILLDVNNSFSMSYKEVPSDEEETAVKGAVAVSSGFEFSRGKRTYKAGVMWQQNAMRDLAPEAEVYYGATLGVATAFEYIDSGIGLYYAAGERKDDGDTSKAQAFGLLLSSSYRF